MSLKDISPKVRQLANETQKELAEVFAKIDANAEDCTLRVMDAFQEFRVAEACFAGTTGYGYDDLGRETLDKIYARVFEAESALVRIGFVNGTHAIGSALFAISKPGETLLSVTGAPYDTLQTTIGITGDGVGSLKYFGVNYAQVELLPNGAPDLAAIKIAAADEKVGAITIQRSRGYGSRPALGIDDIEKIIKAIRSVNTHAHILVDNCYGEFTENREPTAVGADLIAGSLIKNPGGGLAPTGGYIAGRADLVERAARRLTMPGIGGECGSTLGNNRLLFQGFFMAPHTTAQALKTMALCAGMLQKLGYKTSPAPDEARHDIIQMIEFGSAEKLCKFCAGIQHGSPVDSYVTPLPWAMPGYEDEVVMAAGAFIQGSSIELSCDGPLREPFTGYVQGGLTFESGKLGIMLAVDEILAAE
ncbi:MAG: methionine gamma-lyase family protein [Oscillospiraceae bacterium]